MSHSSNRTYQLKVYTDRNVVMDSPRFVPVFRSEAGPCRSVTTRSPFQERVCEGPARGFPAEAGKQMAEVRSVREAVRFFCGGQECPQSERVRSAEWSEDRSRSGVLLLEGFPQRVFSVWRLYGRDENRRIVRQFGADRLGQLFVEQDIALGDGQQTLLVEQPRWSCSSCTSRCGTPRARWSRPES